MVNVLLVILVTAAVVVIALWLYIKRQGDAKFAFLLDQRTDFTLASATEDRAVFVCRIPYVNNGTQDGTLVDVFPRHLLPSEQYSALEVRSWLTWAEKPRTDGYWEAIIVPKGTGNAIILVLEFHDRGGGLAAGLKEMVDMRIDIIYQAVGRAEWYLNKASFVLPAAEIRRALDEKIAELEEQVNASA